MFYRVGIENGPQNFNNLVLQTNQLQEFVPDWRCEDGCGNRRGCTRTVTYDVSSTNYLIVQFLLFPGQQKVFPWITNFNANSQRIIGNLSKC